MENLYLLPWLSLLNGCLSTLMESCWKFLWSQRPPPVTERSVQINSLRLRKIVTLFKLSFGNGALSVSTDKLCLATVC